MMLNWCRSMNKIQTLSSIDRPALISNASKVSNALDDGWWWTYCIYLGCSARRSSHAIIKNKKKKLTEWWIFSLSLVFVCVLIGICVVYLCLCIKSLSTAWADWAHHFFIWSHYWLAMAESSGLLVIIVLFAILITNLIWISERNKQTKNECEKEWLIHTSIGLLFRNIRATEEMEQ